MRNRNSLHQVETNYASVRMTKADRARYNAMHKLIPKGFMPATLADCQAIESRSAELRKMVNGMVASGKLNPVQHVGDVDQNFKGTTILGGVMVYVDSTERHGIIAADGDLRPVVPLTFATAVKGCEDLRERRFDWHLPHDRGAYRGLASARTAELQALEQSDLSDQFEIVCGQSIQDALERWLHFPGGHCRQRPVIEGPLCAEVLIADGAEM